MVSLTCIMGCSTAGVCGAFTQINNLHPYYNRTLVIWSRVWTIDNETLIMRQDDNYENAKVVQWVPLNLIADNLIFHLI